MDKPVAVRIILPGRMIVANGVELALNTNQRKLLHFLSLYYPEPGLAHDEMISVFSAANPHISASTFQDAADEISQQIGHIIGLPENGKPFSLIAWDGSFFKLAPTVSIRRIEPSKYIWLHQPVTAEHPALSTRYGMTVNGSGHELTENVFRFLSLMAAATEESFAVSTVDLVVHLKPDVFKKGPSGAHGPLDTALGLLNDAIRDLANAIHGSPQRFSGIVRLSRKGYYLSPDIYVEVEKAK